MTLDLLRCLRCLGPLTLENSPPGLRCPACSETYPEISGVPRFTGESYAASFGRQWNRYDVARDAEDDAVFRVKTGVSPESLRDKAVLDAGCGGGRYARLVGSNGARLVGVDLSSAVEKARSLCSDMPNVTILQADLLNLPLAENAFDFAFSIGVLHHGPDPRGAFASIARRVKPGGKLAVWLYIKNTWPQELINSTLRAVSTRLPARVLEPLCVGLGVLGGIPIINKTLNKIFNFSNHRDRVLRICDNFDWYAPRYQSHHTLDELKRWFVEEGFDDLIELRPAKSGRVYDWAYRRKLVIGGGVNVLGTKRG